MFENILDIAKKLQNKRTQDVHKEKPAKEDEDAEPFGLKTSYSQVGPHQIMRKRL